MLNGHSATLLLPLAALLLLGCPATNATPCTDDTQCTETQRCRRGACGPVCLDDTDCGDAQVCRAGACVARPECGRDTDCATGFECKADRCQCTANASCAANQLCTEGRCETQKRCTADSECLGTNGRCEVTQGLCLPVCRMPQDCAPSLDPNVAFALYTCVQGTCTRRCTADLQCGGEGLICQSGLCVVADCKTKSDCAAGQYCTNATFGRCVTFTPCSVSAPCPNNFECRRFQQLECPPGFDCNQHLCLELPRCLADGDCLSGVPGAPGTEPSGYCDQGHCQATKVCSTSAICGAGKECVAGLCVPSVCRGDEACTGASACIDGACAPEPAPGEINQLQLFPATGTLEVGDSLRLSLLAYRLDGSSYPLPQAVWAVVDAAGTPSALATVTAEGVVTAVAPGTVKVRASVAGSFLAFREATLTLYPQVTAGRRVLVVDAASGAPLAGVAVRGCEDLACTTPTDVTTDALGVADFPAFGALAATFTAVDQAVRTDGLPERERASVIGTQATDVYLPLRKNPVKAQGGFNGTINFSSVTTTGSYWAGFIISSVTDVPSMTPEALLGESFFVEIEGIGQRVPVPGPLVLYTSPAFGIPREVKPRSLGFGQPGLRFATAWAGRTTLDQVLTLRSTDFLGYLGAFDYSLNAGVTVPWRPLVSDTADIDGDGLCASPTRCPMGTENVADYANFAPLSAQPERQQRLRSEVVVPKLPSTFDTVLVAATRTHPAVGLLPVGFASRAAGAPGADGLRPVEPVVLRQGPPYGGVEVASPGILALATNTGSSALSARMTRGASVPARVLLQPFLPAPVASSYQAATRTVSPGQPAWASIYSSGGEVARVGLTGKQQRHTVYFAIAPGQTAVQVPVGPAEPGADPASESGTLLEVVAVDLSGAGTFDGLWTLNGLTLSNWAQGMDGYCRLDR